MYSIYGIDCMWCKFKATLAENRLTVEGLSFTPSSEPAFDTGHWLVSVWPHHQTVVQDYWSVSHAPDSQRVQSCSQIKQQSHETTPLEGPM